MNKFKYWGVAAGIATFLTIFGAWAKITHQAYADTVFKIGMWSLAGFAAVYVYFKFTALKK
jgi:hypothetical protein